MMGLARVLIFDTSSRLDTVGGAQRVAANLFYELRKRGLETFYLGYRTDYLNHAEKNVMFLKPSKQRELKKFFEKHKVDKVIESKIVRIGYYTIYSLRGINTVDMVPFLKKIAPDVILASSITDYVILKKVRRFVPDAKIIYVDHANASGTYNGAFDYNIMHLTFGTGRFVGLAKARKRFFEFFDGIIALNIPQYEAIKQYNKNVTIIHSSSLLEGKKPTEAEISSFKKRMGLAGKRIVLYLGRLSEAQKNVSALIKAFQEIDDESMRLLIVGDGKSRQLYEEMASKDRRIILAGRVPEDMLPLYYSIADLYVLPSIWESFNATFIEAATFGAPLLLSENAINKDIEERFGRKLMLFNPNDIEELRNKITAVLNDKALRNQLLELSKDIAKEYSKKAQMDAYANAIKKFYKDGTF